MDVQLTLDFKPTVYAGYETLREFINDFVVPDLLMNGSVYTHRKQIAADLDLSPSLFARKLSGHEKNAWTSDDTENLMKVTGTKEPAKYLAWVYLRDDVNQKDEEIKKLRELLAQKERASK